MTLPSFLKAGLSLARDSAVVPARGCSSVAKAMGSPFCCAGLLLGGGGEGVLGFAADAVLLHQVLGGDAHVVVVEGVPQAVLDHGVHQLGVAHAQPGTGTGHHVGGEAHVLLAAGDHHLGIAAADGLGREVQGLEAGAADLVQGQGRHGVGQPGEDGGLAGGVLAGACGEHLAEDDLVDLGPVEAGLGQQLADHSGAQLRRGDVGQRALEAADGGTGGGNDDDVLHVDSSSRPRHDGPGRSIKNRPGNRHAWWRRVGAAG